MAVTKPVLLTGAVNQSDDDCACPDKALLLTFDYAQSSCDNDCACPDHPGVFTGKGWPDTVLVKTPLTHIQSLAEDHYLVYSPYAPAGPSVLNRAAWERWQQFAEPLPQKLPIDSELFGQALLQPHGADYRPQFSAPETLTAWLHVTNACNLDCPYCYVRKSSARMDESVGLKAVEQLFHSAEQNGFKTVKLKYAGGEATLHFKLIRRLHEAAKALAQQSGLALREVVLSNGVHMREQDINWLAETGVKLMISLDGVGETHDQQRPMKGGGRTFQYIENTVDNLLLRRGIQPDVTITITQRNAMTVADAVRWALERNLPVSLNFFRENLRTTSRTDLALEEQSIITGMLAAYAVFEEFLPEAPFLNGLLDRVQAQAHAHTCGVQHSYVVVTHEGKLAQCQMHLDYPVANTVQSDMLPMVRGGLIQNLSVDTKEGCQKCEFRYRCTGGCPLETYRVTGRWDVQSPHCHIYKTLFPAALRLEGLRLLKLQRMQC